jgi:hypothetical protein
MTTTDNVSLWDTVDQTPSPRQRAFLRYLTATLMNLVVLNLFVEYGDHVVAASFTVTLIASVLLQALLKLTIALEHRLAAYFTAKQGGLAKFMRYFSAWLVLFGSKFVILEALSFALGDRLRFGGPFHGIVALIVVVVTMLVVEAAIVKFLRSLG